jgi:hypothetical protein
LPKPRFRNDGKDLQRLIRTIEAARNAGQPIKIESPRFFLDKVTGEPREHDVVLTINIDHHEVVIAIECRDRSRPVEVNAIESFYKKCQDTGVHRGVMVSSKGFTKAALMKATHCEIRCLHLQEVESFNWCDIPGITVLHRQYNLRHVGVLFPEGTPLDQIDSKNLRDERDKLVDPPSMVRYASRCMNQAMTQLRTDPGDHTITINARGFRVFAPIGDSKIEAECIRLVVDYTNAQTVSPFAFRSYTDLGKKEAITEVAVATVPIGRDRTAEFVLSTNDDGCIVFSVVPNEEPSIRTTSTSNRGTKN